MCRRVAVWAIGLPVPVAENYPLGTRRCCDVESTLMALIQRRMTSGKLFFWLCTHTGDLGTGTLPAEAGTLVQWLKLPAWEVGDRGFEPHSGLQVSKKQNVSSLLTRKDSILWLEFRILCLERSVISSSGGSPVPV